MSRPSNYDVIVKPRLEEIKNARANGTTVSEIAEQLGIPASTLYNYISRYSELKTAMKEAVEVLHSNIEVTATKSLFNKLHDRFITVEEVYEDGVLIKEKKALVKADTTAIIFTLKSRNPEQWDPLGVARIEKDDQTEDVNAKILETLSNYTTTDKNGDKNG